MRNSYQCKKDCSDKRLNNNHHKSIIYQSSRINLQTKKKKLNKQDQMKVNPLSNRVNLRPKLHKMTLIILNPRCLNAIYVLIQLQSPL